jgi:uncharacterized BrkB/YihY/UPF0761 family membrane protein
MGDRRPQSLWDRVWRAVQGWMDDEGPGDEAGLAFILVFVAPVVLAFVMLLRRWP